MTSDSPQLVCFMFMVSLALTVTPTAPLNGIIEYSDANLPVAGSFEETDSSTDRARARALLLTRLVCIDAPRPEAELVRLHFGLMLHTQENSGERDNQSSFSVEKAK